MSLLLFLSSNALDPIERAERSPVIPDSSIDACILHNCLRYQHGRMEYYLIIFRWLVRSIINADIHQSIDESSSEKRRTAEGAGSEGGHEVFVAVGPAETKEPNMSSMSPERVL